MDMKKVQKVLSAYPKDQRMGEVYPVSHPSGLSGAEHWKIDATAGVFCLRRWAQGQPHSLNRLQYIQAVLWHAVYEGFDLVPLPCETSDHKGFVFFENCFWELLPWMGGERDYPKSFVKKTATDPKSPLKNGSESIPLQRPVSESEFRPMFGSKKTAKNPDGEVDYTKSAKDAKENGFTIHKAEEGKKNSLRHDSLHSVEEIMDTSGGESEKTGSPMNPESRCTHCEEHSIIQYRKTDAVRIVSAMLTLAQFHEITSTFPLPNEPLGPSGAVCKRLEQWKKWVAGDITDLLGKLKAREKTIRNPREWEMIRDARSLLDHFLAIGVNGMRMYIRGSRIRVPIQPCIGNANRRHLLFDREGVCGILDFKNVGADSVALDIAMLLGSMAGNDSKLWTYGLKAYRTVRNLSEEEIYLTTLLDLAEMLLSGMEWLERLFLKNEKFRDEQIQAIQEQIHWQVSRLDEFRFGHSHFVA